MEQKSKPGNILTVHTRDWLNKLWHILLWNSLVIKRCEVDVYTMTQTDIQTM